MTASIFAWLAENYQWQATLYGAIGVFLLAQLGKLARVIPAFGHARQLNTQMADEKMAKPHYAANQQWNRKWAPLFLAVIYLVILPFALTTELPQWWMILVNIFVVLMVYDFFYYLTHRYLFHDNNFLKGPLVWVHAVHHRQHNTCELDASYIHPLEVALGLGLFVLTIFFLSLIMGRFDYITLATTWFAFSKINLHNHALWDNDKFPYRYLNYASRMHHNHHARFTSGNFATISLFYDWLFGTLDDGDGWGPYRRTPGDKQKQKQKQEQSHA